MYTQIKSCRVAFYGYETAIISTLLSLADGYVTRQFLLCDQLAAIVKELTNDEFLRRIELSPTIRVSYEAIHYKIQLF